jgi:hypothetical protein
VVLRDDVSHLRSSIVQDVEIGAAGAVRALPLGTVTLGLDSP